jgi:hypothetical protein
VVVDKLFFPVLEFHQPCKEFLASNERELTDFLFSSHIQCR